MRNVRAALSGISLVLALAGCGRPAGGGGSSGDGGDTVIEPWTLQSATGRQVVIQYTMGGCKHDPTITHQESATRVVITVRVRTGGAHQVCPAILMLRTARVTLADPVGGRTILDGATGSPPPTGSPFRTVPPGTTTPTH